MLGMLGGGSATAGIICDAVRGHEAAEAATVELRSVAVFLREASLASPALLQLLSNSSPAVPAAASRQTTGMIESDIQDFQSAFADISPLAMVALRIFVPAPGSKLFRAQFYDLTLCSDSATSQTAVQDGLQFAAEISEGIARQLVQLIADENMRLSKFSTTIGAVQQVCAFYACEREQR